MCIPISHVTLETVPKYANIERPTSSQLYASNLTLLDFTAHCLESDLFGFWQNTDNVKSHIVKTTITIFSQTILHTLQHCLFGSFVQNLLLNRKSFILTTNATMQVFTLSPHACEGWCRYIYKLLVRSPEANTTNTA